MSGFVTSRRFGAVRSVLFWCYLAARRYMAHENRRAADQTVQVPALPD
jgi:hypothetical protein